MKRMAEVLGFLFLSLLLCEFLWAEDSHLETVKLESGLVIRAPSVQIRTTSVQPEELKSVPDVKRSSFIRLKFGEKSLCGMFVLDGAGRYRSLYFDTNGDGDLTNEEELKGVAEGDSKKVFEIKECSFKVGEKEMKGLGFVVVTSGDSINCVLKANWGWKGQIKFGDAERTVIVFDKNLDGSAKDESEAWIDFDGDGRLGLAEMVLLDEKFLYGEREYLFRIAEGDVLRIESEKADDWKGVKSPYEGLMSVVKGEEVIYVKSLDGAFYLPKGKYKVGNVLFSKVGEDGAVWDMMYKSGMELDPENTKEIQTPEPLKYQLSVSPDENSGFTFSLQTSAGVWNVSLYRNGERLGNPKVLIKDESGKTVHQFNFTPG
ncbi:MAG: hypothetical protein N2234_07480 [Planctomycetota bacterium]|nr:hypothetical protein [Planctomycetota bacterium]